MTKVKIAVSLPEAQVAAAKQAVVDGRASSVSAYVSQALDTYGERDGLRRYLDELDERYGPTGPEAETSADEVFARLQDRERQGGYPSR